MNRVHVEVEKSIRNAAERMSKMDQVDQFIQDGVKNSRSFWVIFQRQLSVFFVVWTVFNILVFNSTFKSRGDIVKEELTIFIGTFVVILVLFSLYSYFRLRNGFIFTAWRRMQESNQEFDYVVAAKALREFKTMIPQKAVEKYGQETVDLLLVSSGIWYNDKKLRRMVSIEAVDEGRAAGSEDDEE